MCQLLRETAGAIRAASRKYAAEQFDFDHQYGRRTKLREGGTEGGGTERDERDEREKERERATERERERERERDSSA